MNKDSWLALAEAYCKDQKYYNMADAAVRNVREKMKEEDEYTDFDYQSPFSPYQAELLINGVLKVLGDDFSYWFYDCNRDFDKFNEGITLADESHPSVHSLSDLFEFAKDKETGLVVK